MKLSEEFISKYGGMESLILKLEATGKFKDTTFRLSEMGEERKKVLFSQLVENGKMSHETFNDLTNQTNKVDLSQELVLSVLG